MGGVLVKEDLEDVWCRVDEFKIIFLFVGFFINRIFIGFRVGWWGFGGVGFLWVGLCIGSRSFVSCVVRGVFKLVKIGVYWVVLFFVIGVYNIMRCYCCRNDCVGELVVVGVECLVGVRSGGRNCWSCFRSGERWIWNWKVGEEKLKVLVSLCFLLYCKI